MVQQTNFAYTPQGWLKWGNGTAAIPMGLKAVQRTDAFGYGLHYYGNNKDTADYTPIGGKNPLTPFNNTPAGLATFNGLYNGNIAAMTESIPQLNGTSLNYYTYRYDQLNRIKAKQVYQGQFGGAAIQTTAWQEGFQYDGNGNITNVSHYNDAGNPMDSLAYQYNKAGGRLINNQLNYITDTVSTHTYPYGLDNEQPNNYTYDAIGNMTNDLVDTVTNINWTVYGKIWNLQNSKGTINYTYDAAGQRVSKQNGATYTWYVRDAQGNTLAEYTGSLNIRNPLKWIEQDLYGSSRLGMWQPNVRVGIDSTSTAWNIVGHKMYEQPNHLGNVMATIRDKRLQFASPDGTTLAYFTADVATAQSYYAFGGLEPGNTFTFSNNYKYGFNGKENDNDVKGVGNQINYGMRIEDSRLGRFDSVDPLTQNYPWYTPYQVSGNTPIQAVDMDGSEPAYTTKSGMRIIGRDGGLAGRGVKEKPQLKVTPDVAVRVELTVAMADIYGRGWIGKESWVKANITRVKQEYNDAVEENIKDGLGGTIGYFIGGDKGSFIGATVDGVAMSVAGNGAPGVFPTQVNATEPSNVQSNSTLIVESEPVPMPSIQQQVVKIRPGGMSSMEWGNQLHYDQLNGSTGAGLPTELQLKYPKTEFRFTLRGAKGADVEVVSGEAPWNYPGSSWKKGKCIW